MVDGSVSTVDQSSSMTLPFVKTLPVTLLVNCTASSQLLFVRGKRTLCNAGQSGHNNREFSKHFDNLNVKRDRFVREVES